MALDKRFDHLSNQPYKGVKNYEKEKKRDCHLYHCIIEKGGYSVFVIITIIVQVPLIRLKIKIQQLASKRRFHCTKIEN